jgi:hypothetical protein
MKTFFALDVLQPQRMYEGLISRKEDKTMKKVILAPIIYLIIALTLGCSGSRSFVKNSIPEIVTVEKTKVKAPAWVTKGNSYWEDKDTIYVAGGVHERKAYDLAVTEARAEAYRLLAESMRLRLKSEFAKALEGSNNAQDGDLGEFITSAVAFTMDHVVLQGAKPTNVYYERKASSYGTSWYDVYALVKISKPDYYKSRNESVAALAKKYRKANDKKAEERALALLEKLRSEVF